MKICQNVLRLYFFLNIMFEIFLQSVLLTATDQHFEPEYSHLFWHLCAGYTQLCDWWSVGVILFEMLVGQPPFLAPTPTETQIKVSEEEKRTYIHFVCYWWIVEKINVILT